MNFTSDVKEQVQRYLASGSRLKAIKYLCDTFRISIEEAKVLVEAAEKDMENNPSTKYTHSDGVDEDLRSEIAELLKAGKKLEAVRLAKQRLRTTLKETVGRVEEIGKQIDPNFKPITAGTGCARVVTFFFGIVSLLLLGGAAFIYIGQSETIDNGVEVKGTVIEMVGNEGAEAPVIAYSWEGEEKVYHSSTYTNPPSFFVGEEVTVIVNRTNPDDIVVDSFSERWVGIVILGVLGMAFGLITFAIVYVSRRF